MAENTQKNSYKVHIISGTHWDREWRYTAEQSKLRLANLVDHLLEVLDRVPDFRCFHLDGGAVVLDDYFSVRPENKDRIQKYMQEGRISLVNWYTLPETFTVAPEALIRNLMVGKRVADEVGGAMKTGYTATSYGQTSQLPQIYNGFGIETAMFYRGTNKHAMPPFFRWQSPDGSELKVVRCFDEVTRTNWFFFVHQPVVIGKYARDLSYYYNAAEHPVHMADMDMYLADFQILNEDRTFPRDEERLRKALKLIMDQATPQAIGRHVLALDMEDNAKPYEHLPELARAMTEVAGDAEFVVQNVDDYMAEVLADADVANAYIHPGEIRFPAVEPGFNGLLGSTHSSRVRLKILNDQAETELACLAEPLASWAALMGWEYPRTLLDRAWKELLLNHAHDDIVGAAIDEAHEDMLPRFRAAVTVGREVSRWAIEELWKKIDLSKFGQDDLTLTFFNTQPFARKGVVPLVIDIPREFETETTGDPALGVGAIIERKAVIPDYRHFDIVDESGNKLAYTVLSSEKMKNRIESQVDTAALHPITRLRVLVEADVPAAGYATIALHPREPRYVPHPKPEAPRALIAGPDGTLENEFLAVRINANGTFTLTDKANSKVYTDQHLLHDGGAIGNAHLYKTPLRNFDVTSVASSAQVTLEESTPLRGIYRIDITLSIPREVTSDGKDRSRERVELPVTTWITLRKGARRLEMRTRVYNEARDHRLRVLFPTNIETNEVAVESAFAVEKRNFLWPDTGDNMEGHYPIQPMQNFVDVSDGKLGFAFLGKGLREYEVIDDARRTLAITLLRGHRAYMTSIDNLSPDELERHIRGQHSLGEHEFEYALYPHRGDWQAGEVLREAYDHKVPMRVLQGVAKGGQERASQSLLEIEPRGAAQLSALCQSEDGKATILRLWNVSQKDESLTIRFGFPVAAIKVVRMDETMAEGEAQRSADAWKVALPKGKILTLRIEQ